MAVSIVVAALALFGVGFASLLSPLLADAVFCIVLCAAGFISVIIYRSQSTEPVSASAGARLGWMTGLWLFLVALVAMAVVAVNISSPAGREALAANPELAKRLGNPHELLALVPVIIVPFFLMTTLLPGVGGILGAMFSKRVRPNSQS